VVVRMHDSIQIILFALKDENHFIIRKQWTPKRLV